MVFWIFAVSIALLALAWMAYPLLRPKKLAELRSTYDIQIYKDQLKEVESDLARGTLNAEEANASRTEISRRLLAAADAKNSETTSINAPRGVSQGMAAALVVALFAGAFALYFQIGAPGAKDLPLAERLAQRPTQAEAEARIAALPADTKPQADPKHLELVLQLQDSLQSRPDDLTGHQLLADNLSQLGQYAAARVAQDNVVRILGDAASAEDYASQAEIMIIAANWYVSPAAEIALANAFQSDQFNPRARFYAGVAMLQRGQPAQTYQLWSGLLGEGHETPWMAVIENEIDAVAAQAGITRGPTSADVDAASDLSPEDRADMIRNMVANLSDRLAREGGTPEEWAQLIRAYGVLGETAQASAIWNEAQEVFGDNAQAMETLIQAARDAEVSAR